MNNFIITKNGCGLYSGALTGESLEFTKLCIGSGKEDGKVPSEQDIRNLDGLYSPYLELTDLTVERGVLTCVDVDASVFNCAVLPETTEEHEEGAYIYVTQTEKLYQNNGEEWEEKSVNSEVAEKDGYFYDVASGKLKIYVLDESIVTIKAIGNNASLESGFYEKELGLYAKQEDGKSEILFAYAYVRNSNTNFISPLSNGVINLEYSIAFSVSQDANIEILNASNASVSPSSFNELSKTVNEHIESTRKIHEGLQTSLGVSDLSNFSVGSIVIEKNDGDIPEATTSVKNITAKDTFAVIIGKLKRVISDFYKHGHKSDDIDGIDSVFKESVIIGEYIGDGTSARKIPLEFTPRMVEVYCPGMDSYHGSGYSGIAIEGINGVGYKMQSYIKQYDDKYCTVSICDKGFLVSEHASCSDSDHAHTNKLNRQYIYKATR